MFNRRELKERAKLVLLRSYSKVFLACLIIYLLSGGGVGLFTKKVKMEDLMALPPERLFAVFMTASGIALIAILLSIFVVSPLRVGLKGFMIENASRDAQLNLLLTPFGEDYRNIVLVQFMKGLFITLWAIPAYLPTLALGLLADKLMPMINGVYQGSMLAGMALLGVATLWLILTAIFAVPSVIKALQYVMVPYIVAENPGIEWRDALSESKEMMVGNKWAYVKLILSFALWYLAAYLLCCVGEFLVAPYVEATVCELYMELSGKTIVSMEY